MSLPNSFITSAKKQSGTVLLALLLIILTATSYALITNLNDAVNTYTQHVKGLAALQEAKQALIGFALRFPEYSNGEYGPGYLPCPDINDNGSAGTSCSFSGGTSLGRLPYKTLEIDNLKDNAGETIWYALSDNFRDNPKLVPLNSETPGQLTVDGVGDIVAVLIAPGVAISSQDRSSANVNDPAQYLDGENADGDTVFASSSSSDQFNDLVVTITRTELMRYIDRRVMGEVKTALASYRDSSGLNLAYPWLAPFADPKTDHRRLIGTAGSGGSNTVLKDGSNTTNFNTWNVSVGDVVHNLTDGSVATVSSIDSSSQITTSGLVRGTNNSFSTDDVYVIETHDHASAFTGSAGSGTSGTTLVDSSKNFQALGVGPGDVIEDLTDGSMGIIKSADSSGTIAAESLSGGTSNSFNFNDQYRIRTNAGVAGSGSSGQTLVDNTADFVTSGITINDYIHNLTDDTIGKVASVSANQITVSNPDSTVWSDVSFNQNDVYEIMRHLPLTGIRAGQLAFHDPGQQFFTGFQFDWDLPTNTTASITYGAGSTDADYQAGLKSSTKQSSGMLTDANAFNIAAYGGLCRFDRPEVADCYTKVTDSAFLSGTATSGSSGTTLEDTSKDFAAAGIKVGDKVIANGLTGYIHTVGTTTLGVTTFPDSFSITSGDQYRIYVQTTSPIIDRNNVFANSPSNYFWILAGTETVSNGDIIINKYNANYEVGYVTSATKYNFGTNYWLIYYSNLQGGDTTDVNSGGEVAIYSLSTVKYVNKREYVLQPSFSGGMVKHKDILTSGTTTNISTGTILEDSSNDFITDGIRAGDEVENITGNLQGLVQTVNSSTKLTVASISGMTAFSIGLGDQYRIYDAVRKRTVCVGYDSGCTTAGSGTTFAADTSKPMVIVTDYDSGGGQIASAELNVSGSSQGIIRLADMDYYLSTYPFNVTMSKNSLNGTATNISTGTTLEDSAATFVTDGVKAGDKVENTTDNLQGFVQSVESETSLTVTSITGQTAFSIGLNDQYQIYPQDELPLWFVQNNWQQLVYVSMSAAGGSGICIAGSNCLNLYAASTTGTTSTLNNNVGALVMMAGPAIDYRADCTNASSPNLTQDRTSGNLNAWFECENAIQKSYISGTATNSGTGSTLEDTSTDFTAAGVQVGDRVENITNNLLGLVQAVNSSTSLTVASINGLTTFSIGLNDQYRIYPVDDVFQQRDYDAANSSYVLARRTSQFNDSVYVLKDQ